MKAAQGILTVRGGMTSHAAVVARGMGTCCVSGCGDIDMDEDEQEVHPRRQDLSTKATASPSTAPPATSTTSIIPTVDAAISGDFGRFMGWADKYRKLQVRTNADTPRDAKQAREFGAEGIGLCRTEHMFFEGDRIDAIREMIVLRHRRGAARRRWPRSCPISRATSRACTRRMEGCPVTIRFLDPAAARVPAHQGGGHRGAGRRAGHDRGGAQEHHRLPARVQPDDGPPRLPSGRHLSGDRRDADHAPSSTPPSTSRRSIRTGTSCPRS